jgi:CPA2 family monovalent cation:H+ antiporter-2
MPAKKKASESSRKIAKKAPSKRPARSGIAPEVRRAVLATDLSPAALGAANAARFVRDTFGATITILYVLDHSRDPHAPGAREQGEWRDRVEDEIARFADAHGLSGARIVLSEGEPAQRTLETVKQSKADLVIAGRRGSHATSAKALGTTARRLVRKCPVSVLVARREFDGDVDRVGASTDLSAGADRAVRRAALIASKRGLKELHVLHAVEIPSGGFAAYSNEEFVAHRRQAATEQVGELIETFGPGFGPSVRVEVGEGRSAEALASLAKARRLDLLCVGAHGAGGTALLLGSTAERLLDLTPCSVWIEKSREDQRKLVEKLARLIG